MTNTNDVMMINITTLMMYEMIKYEGHIMSLIIILIHNTSQIIDIITNKYNNNCVGMVNTLLYIVRAGMVNYIDHRLYIMHNK